MLGALSFYSCPLGTGRLNLSIGRLRVSNRVFKILCSSCKTATIHLSLCLMQEPSTTLTLWKLLYTDSMIRYYVAIDTQGPPAEASTKFYGLVVVETLW